MYLKSLEVNGFKSFSNKVNIDFTKGITAIVGPNGSGKSNILDAVLWVLGEQSYKSIRAKDSTDVIFSGGKNKKARSSAYVSLTIDNSDRYLDIDKDEITITRSISRNGDSSYSLNGVKTRLKDINNILMDTGIGKQAYSVIGQGKVERIISSSSSELRNIIDEAAGIKKAKSEKELANKRLVNVENEIEKIEYVELELKRRVESLEQQSKKAKMHLAYTKEINALKYVVYKFKLDKIKKENEELTLKRENLKDHILEERKKLEENDKKIILNRERQEEIKRLKENNINKNQIINSKLDELKNMQSDKLNIKANFNTDIKLKEFEMKTLKDKKDKLEKETEFQKDELDKIQKEIESNKNEINRLEKIIENRRLSILNLEDNIIKCDENLKKFEVDKIKINVSSDDSKVKIERAKNKIISTKEELENSKIELEKIGGNIIDEDSYNKEKEEYSKLKLELEKEKNIRSKLEASIESLSNKKNILKNNIENYKLASNAARYIFENSKNDDKVYGSFVNLIDVPNEYQLAISTIAGYSLNDIVVEDSLVANIYVDKLKKNKVGSASFLPIKNLSKRQLLNGPYLFARDIVKNISGRNSLESVIEHVFSNAVIVKDLKEGIELSKKIKDKIVTIEGDLISASGRITGGFISKKIDTTLVKKEELKNVEFELSKLENDFKVLNSKIMDIDKILKDKKILLEENEDKLTVYNSKKKSINREILTYEYEINENNEFIKNHIEEITKNNQAIKNIDIKIVENSENRKKYILELEKLKNNNEEEDILSNLNISKAVLLEKESTLSNSYNFKKQEFDEVLKEYKDINEFLIKKDNIFVSLEKELLQISKEISELSESNLKSREESSELEKENNNLFEEYSKLLELESSLKTKLNLDDKDLEILDETLSRNNDEFEDNNEKFEELLEFEDEIKSHYNFKEITEESELKMNIRKINLNEKSRNDLGDVNLSSIKEYEEENNRYLKLSSDRQDLIRSKDSVLELIENIDKDIIFRFNTAVEEISKNFEYMCRELLNHAKGSIKIQNIDDPIETGIELGVKYKNKPEQSLSLLSGGEKSMLAVSFIMAIFMYKPSPFTFFDEVEAALDEANTKKLITLLKRFDSSQFILITHNKETMKGADRLYGVTMNKEIGESVIVSVDI